MDYLQHGIGLVAWPSSTRSSPIRTSPNPVRRPHEPCLEDSPDDLTTCRYRAEIRLSACRRFRKPKRHLELVDRRRRVSYSAAMAPPALRRWPRCCGHRPAGGLAEADRKPCRWCSSATPTPTSRAVTTVLVGRQEVQEVPRRVVASRKLMCAATVALACRPHRQSRCPSASRHP